MEKSFWKFLVLSYLTCAQEPRWPRVAWQNNKSARASRFFCSFLSRRCTTTTWRSVHTRRQVAATCRSDTLQRQIAPCVLENFCENLCSCNRILLPQQVAQIQSDMIFCDLLQRQNSVSETKIFTKIFQYTRSDLSLQLVARPVHMEWSVAPTCCCNLSPSVYRPSEST